MSDAETPVVTDPEQNPKAAVSASFCVNLWNHLRIEAGGEARVCCAFQDGSVLDGGSPMSVDRHSLAEIWNSDALRALRRDMAEGRPVAGCRSCYTDEARGGISMRMRDNAMFESGWLNDRRVTLDDLLTLAVDNDFRLPMLPASLEIEIGNLCNFKCRMCSGHFSTLIAKDPVHQRWAEDQFSAPYHDPEIPPGAYSFRRAGALAALGPELAGGGAGEISRLSFIGGEPLLVREVRWLVEGLVASGQAKDIALLFVSNVSVLPPWLELAARFKRVDFAVSIDGYGEHYDYIRYPGRWSELTERLAVLRAIPNVTITVTSTIQANNVLNITRLFRYLDAVELGFTAYPLHWPHYLAIGALPAAVRRLGAERLRDYAERDCRPQHRPLAHSLAAQFEGGGDLPDPGLLRDLMLFTNDLDASRRQSIHQTDPELVALLADAGFPWLSGTVHA